MEGVSRDDPGVCCNVAGDGAIRSHDRLSVPDGLGNVRIWYRRPYASVHHSHLIHLFRGVLSWWGRGGVAGGDKLAVLENAGYGEASQGERVGTVSVEVVVKFLAAARLVIDADGVVAPNVY